MRTSEHLTKAEIEEKIAALAREHRATDPRISILRTELHTTFWLIVALTSTAVAAFTLAVLWRGL